MSLDDATQDRVPQSRLPDPDLSPYSATQLHFAREAWPMRAVQELRSAAIFRALARDACVAGMAGTWCSKFDSAVRDEVRHARLCAVVGARLGAAPPVYNCDAVRARVEALPEPVARAAALLLVEVAMGETISMFMFRAGRRESIEPLTRAALGAILRDEVRHQHLGWAALADLWPTLAPPRRAALEHEAALGLAASERHIALPAMRWLEQRRPFDPACAALGVLRPEARVEAFYFAVEKLVLPRLTRIGLDGPAAWSLRYRGGRA